MEIRSVCIDGFMGHQAREVDLAGNGVTLVVGPNGAGKSAIVEAVAHCLWGEGLRGRCWNGDGSPTQIVVEAGGVSVERRRKGHKSELSFAVRGEAPAVYETATKAQEALMAELPPFDVWRKSCVLSSSDASRFTAATDMERKVILEDILGLGRLARAYGRAKEDLRDAKASLLAKQAVLEKEVHILKDREAFLSSTEPNDDDISKEVDMEKMEVALTEKQRVLSRMETALSAVRKEIADAQGRFAFSNLSLEEKVTRWKRVEDTCPECGQPVTEKIKEKLKMSLVSAQEDEVREKEALSESLANLDLEKRRLTQNIYTIKREMNEIEVSLRCAQESVRAQRRTDTGKEEIRKKIEVSKQKVEEAELDVDVAKQKAEEVTLCCSVLCPQGVRSVLLKEAVSTLDECANLWLRSLEASMSIKLSSYSESKSGKVSDKISLSVMGVGAKDYASCSGGERRRIDIAILLALGDVARAAYGHAQWTLWCDEVFDALDREGMASLSGVLNELSQERAVVVITHNQSLVDTIDARQTIRLPGRA